MNTPNQVTNPKARFWGNIAKGAFLLVGCFFVAPFIWVAIGGLLGLIVAAAIIIATWMLRPVAFSFAANMRLKLIKAEAAKNPVETLQEDLRRQMVGWETRRGATNQLKSQVLNLNDKLNEIKEKWGIKGADYQKLLSVRDSLVRLYEHRLKRLDEAHVALGNWAREIDRANDIWEAAQAAAAAQESSGMTEDDFFAQLKTETALDSIQTSFNTAISSLDTELAIADNPTVTGK